MAIIIDVLMILGGIVFIIIMITKIVDCIFPNPTNSSHSYNTKCHAPRKCDDRYSQLCKTCKYNKYAVPKSYYKPRRNSCKTGIKN